MPRARLLPLPPEDPTYTPKKAPPRATSAPRRPAPAKRSTPASRQPDWRERASSPKYRPLPADSINPARAQFRRQEPVPKATLLDLAALVDPTSRTTTRRHRHRHRHRTTRAGGARERAGAARVEPLDAAALTAGGSSLALGGLAVTPPPPRPTATTTTRIPRFCSHRPVTAAPVQRDVGARTPAQRGAHLGDPNCRPRRRPPDFDALEDSLSAPLASDVRGPAESRSHGTATAARQEHAALAEAYARSTRTLHSTRSSG